jgi:transposase
MSPTAGVLKEQQSGDRCGLTTTTKTLNPKMTSIMRLSSLESWILGLDVAKLTVQAQLRWPTGRKLRFSFANTTAGFKQLAQILAQHGCTLVHAGLEATGRYSHLLALWLYEQGHQVSLLNPRRVKDYARSSGLRNQTDILDAALIANFVRAHQEELLVSLWRPLSSELQQLQDLVRRRHQLDGLLLGERNRLEGAAALVRTHIERLIEFLKAEKASLEKAIAAHIRSHPRLQRNHELLCTIKGVGSLTAAVLLAEMAGPEQVKRARQAAARAGLSPRRKQSGTSVDRNQGIGHEGNRYLRKALYMPALVAIKHNPALRYFAAKLRAAGKHEMAIICAVMRKLIHISFGILKHQQPFNPSLT